MIWEPTTVAALVGAAVGALGGVLGQVVSERLRQKGQIQHQNRLLLQEMYTQVAQHVNEVLVFSVAARRILEHQETGLPDLLKKSRRFNQALAPLMQLVTPITLVGSQEVIDALTDTLDHARAVTSRIGPEMSEEDRRQGLRAAQYSAHWAHQTVRAMRRDLEVKSATRKPHRGLRRLKRRLRKRL